MLSETGFFEVNTITVEPNKYHAEVTLNSHHDIYSGHFPEQPVTPGVCMIEMVKELYEQQTNTAFTVSGIKAIKFLSVLDPQVQSTINVMVQEMKTDEEGAEIKAEIKDAEKTYFKFRGRFQKR